MLIPPGFANLSFVLTNTMTSQIAMTAIGVSIEDATPSTVIEGAIGAWEDNFAAIVGEEWAGTTVRLSIGTSDPSAPIVIESAPFEGGANTNDTAPPQVATLIRKFTLSGGRKGRGRMFIVGPAEAGIDGGGNFTESQHADNQTRADGFLEDIAAIDGVTSVRLFHTDPDDAPTEVVGLLAVQMVATQRRRLRG